MNWLAFAILGGVFFWLIDRIADRIVRKLDSIDSKLQNIQSKLGDLETTMIDLEIDGKKLVPYKYKPTNPQFESIRQQEHLARRGVKTRGTDIR